MTYLTDREIMNLREPGEYPIGGPGGVGYGVSILVNRRKNGQLTYRWIQYVYIKDPQTKKTIRRRRISLKATYPELMSAEARELGKVNYELASRGIDPTDEREADTPGEQALPPTFREVAAEVVAGERAKVVNEKLSESTLYRHKIIVRHLLEGIDGNRREGIADKRLDLITRSDIFDLMEPYFNSQYPTFEMMWSYARKIFLGARKQWPDLPNPVDETVRQWLGASDHKTSHYDFVPYHLVAESIDKIRSVSDPRTLGVNCALQMVILTGCRGNEVRLMEYDQLRWKVIESPEQWTEDERLWDPVDWNKFDAGDITETIVWFIPGENTKTGEPRRVSMSSGCLQTLREARPLHKRWGSSYVFPSPLPPHGHLSHNSLITKCRRLDLPGTTHGFRTTLRIWWGEVGGNSDAGEMQLGHALGPVKQAYLRTDLLAERAEMMDAWAMYLRGELPDDWEWIPPRLAAKLKAMEKERNAIKEQCDQMTLQIKTLTDSVNGLVASLWTEGKGRGQELLSMLPRALAELLDQQAVHKNSSPAQQ